MFRPPLAVLLTAAAYWPSPAVAQEADPEDETLAAEARTVLRTHCARCHSAAGPGPADFDILDLDGLREAGHLDADDPPASYLLETIESGYMPKIDGRGAQRVSAAEIETLRRWLRAGAPAFPTEADRPFVPLEAVLSAMVADLDALPREDRPHSRYFTLHTLHNTPRALSDDLPLYRAALSKALNSLSWEPKIVVPRAVAPSAGGEPSVGAGGRIGLPAGVLYAIDLRDYGWGADDWREVVRADPYGLSYLDLPNGRGATLDKLRQRILERTGTASAAVRADWFAATAVRPPLYHRLLDLPEREDDLLKRLGIDVADRYARIGRSDRSLPRTVARAGFARSGVSAQNRLVEWLTTDAGFYARSFDFGPDNGRGKLARFPLGPSELAAAQPGAGFAALAFAHDGGEVIFTLPNGLHGYLLLDGAGDRIDEGPIAVVGDSQQTAGTPAIVNGVSCFACHDRGVIDLADDLRGGAAVFGAAEALVRRLHPSRPVMEGLIEEARAEYVRALTAAVGDVLPDPAAAGRPEPIGHVARQHRLVFLDRETIAAELHQPNWEAVRRQVGEVELKRLGLEPLLNDGVVSRPEWEARTDGESLMQQLARELQFTPFTPR